MSGVRSISVLKKNSYADAIPGEVHVEPNEVEIVFSKGNYLKGEKIYLPTPQGEGFYKVWCKGAIDSIEALDFFDNSGNPQKCPIPSAACWGRPKKSIDEQKRVWWVQFKTSDKKIGWSIFANNFSENDSCS